MKTCQATFIGNSSVLKLF